MSPNHATHCPKGHPYSGANLYLRPDGKGRGCRTCLRDAQRLEPAEKKIWRGMLRRTDPAQARGRERAVYINRGITVCERWCDSFDAFLADMGPRPSPKHSIDRIDNDLGYEPGNCRWATKDQQNQNTRRAKLDASKAQRIREAIKGGAALRALAREYGVDKKVIAEIRDGLAWRVG